MTHNTFNLNRRLLLATGALLAAAPAIAQSKREVVREGAKLYVEVHGTGEPVVLLHGGLGHMGWFDQLRTHLITRKRQVVLIDTRGMGRSSLGSAVLSYETQELDVYAVLDALNIAQTDLIGFSDGGIAGYRMAARSNSRVRRLITIGSRWSAENGRSMWSAFESWNRKSLSEGTFKFIVDDYDRLNPDRDFDRLVRSAVSMWKDDSASGHPNAAIDRIGQPVLVAVGDADPFFSVQDAATAKSRIKNAHLMVIPGATHPAYREQPAIFFSALDAFMAQKL
jgi:pimeloyl-ACP methyl ester carboxylesterase